MYLPSPRRVEKCWACSEGQRRSFSFPMMDLFYSSALHAANKWTPWTLLLLSHYTTQRLETSHHIPFHSILTRYLARPRTVSVSAAEDRQTWPLSVVVVVVMLSGEWGCKGRAPPLKRCTAVWITLTKRGVELGGGAPLTFTCAAHEQPSITAFWIRPSQLTTCCECFENDDGLKQDVMFDSFQTVEPATAMCCCCTLPIHTNTFVND